MMARCCCGALLEAKALLRPHAGPYAAYIEPLVRTEVESYAAQTGSRVITVAVLHEARNRGKVVWAPAAKDRLANIPAPIRSMAKVEIERMALAQGLSEVTEALMDEAKAKFLGMRGRP